MATALVTYMWLRSLWAPTKPGTLKAIRGRGYDSPSLIIAYAPYINHGLKKGMGKSQAVRRKKP